MRTKFSHKPVVALFLGIGTASLLQSSAARASGLALDQGARGLGDGYAGASATASDPTTLYYNPAGLTQLPGDQVSIGVARFQSTGEFSDSGHSHDAFGGKLSGDDGGNLGTGGTVPNLYYTHNFGNMAAGIGVSAPYGLGLTYDKAWKGRFSVTQASISVLEIAPAFAYKVADKVSIGASVGYQMLQTQLGAQINSGAVCLGGAIAKGASVSQAETACAAELGQEGSIDLKGKSTAGVFGVGVLYQPTATTNLGLNFRSAAHHKIKGDATFTNTGAFASSHLFTNGKFTSPLTLPASFSLALAQTYGAFGLNADITHTNWSSFQKFEYDYADSTPSTIIQLHWHDTTRVGLGGTYNVTPEIPLRLGFVFDQAAVPGADYRVPSLPDGDRKIIAIGGGYETKTYHIDLGLSTAILADGNSDTTSATGENLVGRFSRASITTLGVQFDYMM